MNMLFTAYVQVFFLNLDFIAICLFTSIIQDSILSRLPHPYRKKAESIAYKAN